MLPLATHFDCYDTFNSEVYLSVDFKKLSHKNRSEVWIKSVNGKAVPQRVIGAYNYEIKEKYLDQLPEYRVIHLADKEKSETIFMYSYADQAGIRRITAGVFSYPVIPKGTTIDWVKIWNRFVSENPDMKRPDPVFGGDLALIFQYKYKKECIELFYGIDQSTRKIKPATLLQNRGIVPKSIPAVEMKGPFRNNKQLNKHYETMKEDKIAFLADENGNYEIFILKGNKDA